MAIINSPTYAQPAAGNDIVGFNIETKTAQSPRGVTWGQGFAPGKVQTTAALTAKIGSSVVPAQMDWKTRHPDGSVRFAVITVPAPTLPANNAVKGMLSIGGTVGDHIAILTALKTYSVIVHVLGGLTATIDIGQKLMAAIRAKTSSYWMRGENATQVRVEIPIARALRLVADVTAYADGTFLTDLTFRNDVAFGDGNTENYGVGIFQNGLEVFHANSITHYWAEAWRQQFHTKGLPTDDTHNVQLDLAYLMRHGVLQNYDLTSGIDDGSIDAYPSVNVAPLSNPAWLYAMPSGGHRDDIGAMPGWYAQWVKCQGWPAAMAAKAIANSAGSIPWHHWDAARGDYPRLDDHPTLWLDYRGTPNMTPEIKDLGDNDGRWWLDTAHAPDVAFIPYLLTGQRFYLDELMAQTSSQIFRLWNQARLDGKGICVPATDALEVRSQFWTFRNLIETAWACPDSHPAHGYWNRILDNNYEHILDVVMPEWTTRAGKCAGYFYGVYGYTQAAIWQQDYAVSVLAVAVGLRPRNNSHALKMMKWAANYNVGIFSKNVKAAVSYQMFIANDARVWFKTWEEMAAGNGGYGLDLPTDGSDFTTLRLQTLALIFNNTGNKQALVEYNKLRAMNGAGTALSDYQTRYPQFHIVPRATP